MRTVNVAIPLLTFTSKFLIDFIVYAYFLTKKICLKGKMYVEIADINARVEKLQQKGILLYKIDDLYNGKDTNTMEFLLNVYYEQLQKIEDNYNFTKNIKLINKNPNFSESFTEKKDIDLFNTIQNGKKAEIAFLMNFIDSFTKKLADDNLQFVFTTQTFNTKFRHKNTLNVAENIKIQAKVLNSFHYDENRVFRFFRNENIKREFIRSIEFHKDLNLHEHVVKAFNSGIANLIKYIKLYEKNRIKHQEIGRCEIVVDSKYKDDIVKEFGLKHYIKHLKNDRKEEFYYSEENFAGQLKNGTQLCIKFFNNEENTATQISKYLVSYLNKSEKAKYEIIFKNLSIKNFTHSQVLFSTKLYKKVFKHLHSNKKIEKYKSMFEFTKAFNNGGILIEFDYENTIYEDDKLDFLINVNKKFNDKLNDYKLDNNMQKYKRLHKYYNKFLAKHKKSFDKMLKVVNFIFVKEKETVKVYVNKYKAVETKLYNKLKNLDNSVNVVNAELKDFEKIEKYDDVIENLVENKLDNTKNEVIEENLQERKQEKYLKFKILIKWVDDEIEKLKNIGGFYVKIAVEKLENTLMMFEFIVNGFLQEQQALNDFKNFNSYAYAYV